MYTNEKHVQQALDSLATDQYYTICQSTLTGSVTMSTLGHRRIGRLPRSTMTVKPIRLNTEQELTPISYTKDLQLQYQPPNHDQIRLIAQKLANQNGSSESLSKH
jgi:hypothetical protein